jgi:hypothetical protein
LILFDPIILPVQNRKRCRTGKTYTAKVKALALEIRTNAFRFDPDNYANCFGSSKYIGSNKYT